MNVFTKALCLITLEPLNVTVRELNAFKGFAEASRVLLLRRAMRFNSGVDYINLFLADISHTVENYGPVNQFSHKQYISNWDTTMIPLLHLAITCCDDESIKAIARHAPPHARRARYKDRLPIELYKMRTNIDDIIIWMLSIE